MYRGGLCQPGQNIGVSAGAVPTALECAVERADKTRAIAGRTRRGPLLC